MTLYTTQQKQYVCWSGQNNHRVGSQQVMLGNEELNFVEEFRYHRTHEMDPTVCPTTTTTTTTTSWLQIEEMIRILKNNSRGKLQLAICWSINSHLHLLRQKSNCSSHIEPQILWMFS